MSTDVRRRQKSCALGHSAADRWGGAAIFDTVIAHARRTPISNSFRYRSYSWLVDLDRLPRVPWPVRPLAQFRAADHLGRPERSLRANVDAFLGSAGIDLSGGRVLMLANARVFGHVFNPLSVYWCHDAAGSLTCVLAEVHNTYGERHCYLLHPDPDGAAVCSKEFYVSPFHPVDGHYRMRLPLPGERLALSVELHRPGQLPFVATVRGTPRPAGVGSLLRAAVRVPLVTRTAAAQIRLQGSRLWWRGLPVVPRPEHVVPDGFR
ncbi:MAG TPA: DUF1365 domain-containing protein [Sporichthyaceae bacterium]|nr:DUF1365 domain-containing protein [Sporichthyaceae bacterium]